MEEVALIIDELRSSASVSHCRICHEAEFESSQSLEAPCACSGTVKFAHRHNLRNLSPVPYCATTLIFFQQWSGVRSDKYNTIGLLTCCTNYEPGYTVTSKKSQSIEAAVTIRDSVQVPRREHEPLSPRDVTTSDAEIDESDYTECAAAADRGATFCRSFALRFTGFLLLRHIIEVLDGQPEQYPFTLLTVLILRIS